MFFLLESSRSSNLLKEKTSSQVLYFEFCNLFSERCCVDHLRSADSALLTKFREGQKLFCSILNYQNAVSLERLG